MTLKSICGIAGLALILTGCLFAQVVVLPSGPAKLSLSSELTNAIVAATNRLLLPPVKHLDEFTTLPPGVYRTTPYACLVKVPGNVRDDIARHESTAHSNVMPVLRPELRPLPPAMPPKQALPVRVKKINAARMIWDTRPEIRETPGIIK